MCVFYVVFKCAHLYQYMCVYQILYIFCKLPTEIYHPKQFPFPAVNVVIFLHCRGITALNYSFTVVAFRMQDLPLIISQQSTYVTKHYNAILKCYNHEKQSNISNCNSTQAHFSQRCFRVAVLYINILFVCN